METFLIDKISFSIVKYSHTLWPQGVFQISFSFTKFSGYNSNEDNVENVCI